MECSPHPVVPPRIVAIATDGYLTPTHEFADKKTPGATPKFGQDITFGSGRAAPKGLSVGQTEMGLKIKMEGLVDVFASGNKGMASKLFREFLRKQHQVRFYEDADLNKAAAGHEDNTVELVVQ